MTTPLFAPCVDQEGGDPSHAMRISPRVTPRGDRWESNTFVENVRGNSHPFHDVVLRSFDSEGEELKLSPSATFRHRMTDE